jgi:ATP-dependent exoDNAse (exonuclease V) beta subunit
MAFRVIQSDWWSELQAGHDRIESEIEVLLRCPVADELCFLRGVIDVLATSSDRALVIDFKTDRLLDPAEYALQLSLYAHAVAGLSENAMPVSIELVHLRSGETRAVTPSATPIEEAGRAIRSLWEDR